MFDAGIVTGSEAMAKKLIVGKSLVYVHTDIERVENPENADDVMYKYHEIQYPKDEYIALISQENTEIGETVNSILTEIIPSLMGE